MQPLCPQPALIDRAYERLVEAIADGTLAPGRRIRRQHEARRQRAFRRLLLLRGDLPPRDAFGGEARGHRVERTADLVEITNSAGVDLGDDQPAPTVFLDQLLLLEELRRMADWLSRHAEGSAEFFLANALPGGERTVSDRLDQLLVGPIDQRRLGIERLHPLAVF